MSVAQELRLLTVLMLLLAPWGCVVEIGPEGNAGEGDLEAPEETRSTQASHTLSVPFVTQKPNEKACTAATMAMAFKFHGVQSIDDGSNSATSAQSIYNWFSSKGYLDPSTKYVDSNRVPEATTTLTKGNVEATIHYWPSADPAPVRSDIDAGHPCMLFTYHNLLPGSGITAKYGHNITVYGYSGDTFYYYNPYKWSQSSAAFSITTAALKAAVMANVHLGFASTASLPPPSTPTPNNCHGGSLFDWTFCSSSCPCSSGQGDCDSDSECHSGLTCAKDVGAKYGVGSTVDVCEDTGTTGPPASCHSGLLFGWTYCSASCPCTTGQGDCDNDDECAAGLVCTHDVGASYGTTSTVDICQ